MMLSMVLSFTSCATILGGKIDKCQSPDQAPRQVRTGYLIADVIFGLIPLGVDFLTNAIYKPCQEKGLTIEVK